MTGISATTHRKDEWPSLNSEQRMNIFNSLTRSAAEDLFMILPTEYQAEIVAKLPEGEKRSWLRFLPPDDVVDLLQKLDSKERDHAVTLIDESTRHEVNGLLAYAEDQAGGLMSPRYLRLRPDMTAAEAILYIRAQARTKVETIYYAYVLNNHQQLLGVISFRTLLLAAPEKLICDIMLKKFFFVTESMDKEDVADFFSKHIGIIAIPVLDPQGKMKGIVTYDDIASVVREEATEDIQKLGGMEALDAPYFSVAIKRMIKKRAGWLTVLFLGEMLTATAMGHYLSELEQAVVLALFIPLIISSGGNSGSQASTLIIRSLALHEIRLRDWLRVLGRELLTGFALGAILGTIGLLRVVLWQQWGFASYGEYYLLIAITVALSLIGVVVWGSLSGSMLPIILRKIGFDPASASAPLVATLVDVTGLIIYFSIANMALKGVLL